MKKKEKKKPLKSWFNEYLWTKEQYWTCFMQKTAKKQPKKNRDMTRFLQVAKTAIFGHFAKIWPNLGAELENATNMTKTIQVMV